MSSNKITIYVGTLTQEEKDFLFNNDYSPPSELMLKAFKVFVKNNANINKQPNYVEINSAPSDNNTTARLNELEQKLAEIERYLKADNSIKQTSSLSEPPTLDSNSTVQQFTQINEPQTTLIYKEEKNTVDDVSVKKELIPSITTHAANTDTQKIAGIVNFMRNAK